MVVIRPTAVTHAFNMEQRLVELSFTVNGYGVVCDLAARCFNRPRLLPAVHFEFRRSSLGRQIRAILQVHWLSLKTSLFRWLGV